MATPGDVHANLVGPDGIPLEMGVAQSTTTSQTPAYSALNKAFNASSASSLPPESTGRFPFPKPSIGHICARCQGIPLEIFQVGSDFLSNKCKGRHREGENCKGKHQINCDSCTTEITSTHYHCGFCNDNNFDICVTCKESGKHCHETDHVLAKRIFDKRLIREVSNTNNSSYNPGITKAIVEIGLEPYRLHDSLRNLIASGETGCHSCSLLVGRIGEEIERTPKDTPVFIENRPVLVPYNTRVVRHLMSRMALEPDLDGDADEEFPATMLALRIERDPINPIYYDDTKDRIVRWLPFELRGTSRMLSSRNADFNEQSLRRQISPVVDGENNLKVIGSWLRSCISSGSRCSDFPKKAFKPTRLIHVDSNQSLDHPLRIVNGHDIENPAVDYATLSYCWGNTGQHRRWMLTNERLPAFEAGISAAILPKTIEDAIKVVRTIGIRYLWVDSLCIIQDDADDWSKEAFRMSQVYNSSLFTIISGSDSAVAGLFLPRDQLKVSAAEVPVRSKTGSETHQVTLFPELKRIGTLHRNGPTSKRAWCYQEELLSVRRVYFTDGQFAWECLCSKHDETGRRCPGDTKSTGYTPPSYDTDILLRDSQVIGEWYSVIEEYTSRLLTFHSDIFAALAGIAASLKPRYKARYLAGLWENDMVNGLLWQRIGKSLARPAGFHAPSWSWLSVAGRVMFTRGSQTLQEPDAEYLGCDVKCQDDEFSTVLPGGTIRLRARMLTCEVAPEVDGQEFEKLNNTQQELPQTLQPMKPGKGDKSDREGTEDTSEENPTIMDRSTNAIMMIMIGDEDGKVIERNDGSKENFEHDSDSDINLDLGDNTINDDGSDSEPEFFLRSGPWETQNRLRISPPGERLEMTARVKLQNETSSPFATVFFDGEDEAKTNEFFVVYLAATRRPEDTIDRNGIAVVPVDRNAAKYRRIGFVAFWDKLIKDNLGFLEGVEKTELILM